MALLSSRAGCYVPRPTTIVLGKQKVTQATVLSTSKGKKFHQKFPKKLTTTKETFTKDTVHYLSLVDTLRLIMSDPEARRMVEAEDASPSGTIKNIQRFGTLRDSPIPSTVSASAEIVGSS